MMSVVFSMAYRYFWKFWQASATATIRSPLKPSHPVSRIAHARSQPPIKEKINDQLRKLMLKSNEIIGGRQIWQHNVLVLMHTRPRKTST
jgi:hypothetical protein